MVQSYHYEKYNEETGKLESIRGNYRNDTNRSITGHIVMDVKAWFDENPEERKRLGWTKHITYDKPEDAGVEYDPQTQYYKIVQRQIDEYTVEDVYYVKDKTEEQLLFEEMLATAQGGGVYSTGITFIGGDL